MKTKLKLLLLLAVLLAFSNCKKETEFEENNSSNTLPSILKTKDAYNDFAKILSKAVLKNPSIREFIKKNALKQINKDYDVFYPFIKNSIVHEGQTFREILKECEEYPNQLDSIENVTSLLTIYVPTLPENSFSPETWNSSVDVPLVATNLMDEDATIPIYDNGEKVLSLKSTETPGFPLLVIKSNERIIKKGGLKTTNNRSKFSDENSYEYLSDAFDNSKEKFGSIKKSEIGDPFYPQLTEISDPEITKAFDIFGSTPEYWQRDYIYYGLTKTIAKGKLKSNYVETITSITLTKDALNKMMDQDDPKLTTKTNATIYLPNGYDPTTFEGIVQKNAWTEGKFELLISVGINNISGVGSVYYNYVSLDPTKAFSIKSTLNQVRPKKGDKRVYIIYVHDVSPLRHDFSIPVKLEFEITPWSLEKNSPMWKVNIQEKDGTETVTKTETTNVDFAGNFEFNLGFTEKIGIKFGASSKKTKQSELKWTSTYESDDLGNVIVDFGDPIILSKSTSSRGSTNSYILKNYSNSYYAITIMPKRAY